KSNHYYAVNIENKIGYHAHPLPLQRPGDLDPLELTVECRLSCEKGNEEKVVQALAQASNMEAALEKCIREAAVAHLRQHIKQHGKDQVVGLFQSLPEWQKAIGAAVHENLGLLAKVKLSPPPGCLEPVQLKQDFTAVHVGDCIDKLELAFEAHLEATDQG